MLRRPQQLLCVLPSSENYQLKAAAAASADLLDNHRSSDCYFCFCCSLDRLCSTALIAPEGSAFEKNVADQEKEHVSLRHIGARSLVPRCARLWNARRFLSIVAARRAAQVSANVGRQVRTLLHLQLNPSSQHKSIAPTTTDCLTHSD